MVGFVRPVSGSRLQETVEGEMTIARQGFLRVRLSMVLVVLVILCWDLEGHAGDERLTPPSGSPVRKQVLDALRREMKRIHGLDVVFVVRELKVKGGWAWVHTLPQSPDGLNRYEDVSALLRLHDEAWEVAEIPCGEADNPGCLNGPEYFVGLLKRFPNAPIEVLPDLAHQAGLENESR